LDKDEAGRTITAATTEPNKAPRPTSSTPAIKAFSSISLGKKELSKK
jgi:hypothetical protein